MHKHPLLAEGVSHGEPLQLEPSLTLNDICRLRSESRRTGERERSMGLWPAPDFHVGIGTRKSPRWRPKTIRRWLEGGCHQ